MPEPRTLCQLFQLSLQRHPRQAAHLRKVEGTYRAVSSQEVADRVQAVASGLRQLGVQPGERVAILAENRLEWALADWAILHCGAATVPIYPTLQAASIQTMLRDSQTMAVFVSNRGQLAKLGEPGDLPHLRHAFLFDGDGTAGDAARQVHTLRELDSLGIAAHDPQGFESTWRAVGAEDIASIIYTSGTSGAPKGVILTHANIVANIMAMLRRVQIGAQDVCLSFLPLSHVLERTCGHFLMWHAGASIAYAESVDTVPQNLTEVRPTVLISVPRIYEKMHARVHAAMEKEPPSRRKLFAWALSVGRERVRREQRRERVPWTLKLQHGIADRLVFSKLRLRLGGRARIMVSGGAPLPHPIAEFFHAAGLRILEGYGLTETSPVIAVSPPQRPKIGTVGPPLDNLELRISQEGEILVRGPSVMRGYWNNPEATREVLDDGWFHTGDVGELDRDGYLRITDRLKDLIVTAGGKKVAPQPIEARLKAFPYVVEGILVGDQRKFVTALLVPNFAHLESFAQARRIGSASHAELVREPEILRLFAVFLGELNAELAPFESIKRFRLLDRELDLKAGEITPSMKVRRSVVAASFAGLIDSMYADPPPAGVGSPTTAAAPAAAPVPTQPVEERAAKS